MMKTISDYKDEAVTALRGNWGNGVLATIIYSAIFGTASSLFGFLALFLFPLVWGFQVFFLEIYRRNNPDFGQLFAGFKLDYWKFVGTCLLKGIYVGLWSLLLIVPGIVKSYSYSMTEFIMLDNPELKYDAAITASSELMNGHKMQLFLLDLSMIGWFILACLTFGIGFLFLIPYNQTAHAAFYQDLIAEGNPDYFDKPGVNDGPVIGPQFEEVR